MTEGKQKLTLSVDAETVERAKSLGINISDLTEQVLKSFTFKPEDAQSEAIERQRKELFDSMSPLISRYKLRVPVGVYMQFDPNPYEDDYSECGTVMMVGKDEFERPFRPDDWEGGPRVGTIAQIVDDGDYISYYPTETLLKNFMKAVEDEKTKQKQQVASLAVARKIIEAITQVDDTEVKQGDASPREPKK
jgi:hypothetical protein